MKAWVDPELKELVLTLDKKVMREANGIP